MTEQERIIVSAYTGYLLCDFDKVHEYIEKKMGRPVWTHEMASENIQKEIREKCRDDFVTLAKSDTNKGKWLEHFYPYFEVSGIECSICGKDVPYWSRQYKEPSYCPNCGAKMIEEET